MKTSVIALSGLAFAAVLGFSTTGCRVTHYGLPAGSASPSEEAICRSTCDRLIEEQAISLDGAKMCLASCTSKRAARPAKTTAAAANAAAAAGTSPTPDTATAARPPATKRREPNACLDPEDDRAEEPCRSRRGVPCACEEGPRGAGSRCRREPPAPARAAVPPPPPASPAPVTIVVTPECTTDWDCPEDTACDAGVCK